MTPFEWQAFWEAITRGHHLDPDPTEREPDYMTDRQADREHAEDADLAADRYERERGY